MSTALRNVLIVFAIAAAVYALPGGGDAATVVGALLGTAISVLFVLIIGRLYREHRLELFGLGDRYRATLYGAIAVAIFAMAARQRLFDQGGAGVLLWFALIGGAAYALFSVFRHYRTYA